VTEGKSRFEGVLGTVDILQHAANVIDNKLAGLAKSHSPVEVKKRMDAGEDFILLDVRTPKELEAMALKNKRVVHIPLGKLRERAGELPRDREIVTFCKISMRGWEAQRILEGEGFANVSFMEGGLVGWPYGTEADTQE